MSINITVIATVVSINTCYNCMFMNEVQFEHRLLRCFLDVFSI